MSIFRQILSCLLPGSPILSAAPPQQASPVIGIPNREVKQLAPTRSPVIGSTWLFSRTNSLLSNSSRANSLFSHVSRTDSSSTTTAGATDGHLEFAGKQFGLGDVIAKAIRMRSQFGTNSGSLEVASEVSAHGSSDTRSPSPFSLDLPLTPEQYGSVPRHPAAFARPTPPEVYWRDAPQTSAHCEKPSNTIPAPLREYNRRNAEARAQYDFVAARTRYCQALLPGFDMPLPYQPKREPAPVPVDSLPNAFSEQEVAVAIAAQSSSGDTQPAWSPAPRCVPTQPAWSPAPPCIPTHPAWSPAPKCAPAPAACDVPQDDLIKQQIENVLKLAENRGGLVQDTDENVEEAHADDYADGVPPAILPQHPDGTVYHIVGKLGEGSFGRVMLAATSNGELVALKVINKLLACADLEAKDLLNERDLMLAAAESGAPFLVHLKAAWEQGDNVYYAMDVCAEDLRSRMKRAVKSGQRISDREAKLLCAELILALEDLSRLEMVHGDIKPDNILITRSGRAVLSDFGLSQRMSRGDICRQLGLPFSVWNAPVVTGTGGYFAPEALLRRFDRTAGSFTYKADIFSIGAVLVELLSGIARPLWDTYLEAEEADVAEEEWLDCVDPDVSRQAMLMMRHGLHGVLDTDELIADPDARDLLSLMLAAKPKDRPDPAQLLQHPYFWDLDIDAVRAGRVPHDYQPRFFGCLDRTVQSVSFRTPRSSRWFGYGTPIGSLKGFTWPAPENDQ